MVCRDVVTAALRVGLPWCSVTGVHGHRRRTAKTGVEHAEDHRDMCNQKEDSDERGVDLEPRRPVGSPGDQPQFKQGDAAQWHDAEQVETDRGDVDPAAPTACPREWDNRILNQIDEDTGELKFTGT